MRASHRPKSCALGADEGYLALLRGGHRPHFMVYIVLLTGLQDRPWNSCGKAERAQLRPRFDALVSQVRSAAARDPEALPPELLRFMDTHGVLRAAQG